MRANTARTLDTDAATVDDAHSIEAEPGRFFKIGFYHCCDFARLHSV